MRHHWPLTVALVATSAIGCGRGEGRADGTVVNDHAGAFSVHEVLAVTVPPCKAEDVAARLVLPAPPERPTECLALGPARVNAEDVQSAQLEPDADEGQLVVALTLTPKGDAELDRMAASNFGERMALVVRGRLVGAPTVHTPEFGGRIDVTGLTRTEAIALVSELGGDAEVPEPDPHAADARRAAAVCEAFDPGGGVEKLNVSVPDSAGAITRKAQQVLGRTIAPWDSLPPDHFVAGCAYSQPSDGEPPSTVCPDGETYSLEIPKQYLVDEQGRSTVDPLAQGRAEPCE